MGTGTGSAAAVDIGQMRIEFLTKHGVRTIVLALVKRLVALVPQPNAPFTNDLARAVRLVASFNAFQARARRLKWSVRMLIYRFIAQEESAE
jgi:hypothetical protein